MFSLILPILVKAVWPVAAAGAAYLSARIAALLGSKAKESRLQSALLRLNDAVATAVKAIEQSVRADFNTRSADGHLTPAEAAQIRDAAVQRVRIYLGQRGISELLRVLGLDDNTLRTLITDKVEAVVYGLRSSRAPK